MVMLNTKPLFFLIFFLPITVLCQTDWKKWGKSEPSYQIQDNYIERDYDLSINSFSDILIKPVFNAYWFFISDVDGANCPFQPSCSTFFLQSIKRTNFVQGTLMFFDRFTRDTNFLNRANHYPYYDELHFYDPVNNYTLDTKEITYNPPNIMIK